MILDSIITNNGLLFKKTHLGAPLATTPCVTLKSLKQRTVIELPVEFSTSQYTANTSQMTIKITTLIPYSQIEGIIVILIKKCEF